MKIERLKQKKKTNSKHIFGYVTVFACFIFVILVMIKITPSFSTKNNIDYSNTNNVEVNATSSSNDEKKNIMKTYSYDDFIDCSPCIDLSNPKEMYKLSPYIAIIKVTSLDGVTKSIEHIDSMTNGKATILKMIKGNIENKNISFKRGGGILTYEKWINGEPYKPGLDHVEDPTHFLVDNRRPNDIDIEKDKIYLAYINEINEYIDKNNNGYYIIGYQYGLREIQNYTELIITTNNKNIRVKNNDTGKWEKITDVIKVLE